MLWRCLLGVGLLWCTGVSLGLRRLRGGRLEGRLRASGSRRRHRCGRSPGARHAWRAWGLSHGFAAIGTEGCAIGVQAIT